MQDTDVVPTRSIRASSLASLGRWSNANKRSAGESDEPNSEGTQSDTELPVPSPPAKRSRRVAKPGPSEGSKGAARKSSREGSVDVSFVNALHAAADAAADDARAISAFSPDEETIDGILRDLEGGEAELPSSERQAISSGGEGYSLGGSGPNSRRMSRELRLSRDGLSRALPGEGDTFGPLFSGLPMEVNRGNSFGFSEHAMGEFHHPGFLTEPMGTLPVTHPFHSLTTGPTVQHVQPIASPTAAHLASGSMLGSSGGAGPVPVMVTARTMPAALAGTMPTAAAVLVTSGTHAVRGGMSSHTSCTSLASLASAHGMIGSSPGGSPPGGSHNTSGASSPQHMLHGGMQAAPPMPVQGLSSSSSSSNPSAGTGSKAGKRDRDAHAPSASGGAGGNSGADGNRKEWSAWEDETIRSGVLKLGSRWRVIAAELPGRSDDAVRNRWARLQQTLTAPGGVRPPSVPRVRREGGEQRQSWTAEEDSIISNSVLEYGHRWNKIAERLPRRTEHAIRNRWHRLQMRSLEEQEGADSDGASLPPPKAAANNASHAQQLAAATTASAPPPAAAANAPASRRAQLQHRAAAAAAAAAPAAAMAMEQPPMPFGAAAEEDDEQEDEDELGELSTGFDFDSVISL